MNNCIKINKKVVSIPNSKLKLALAETFRAAGYFRNVAIVPYNECKTNLMVELKYVASKPAISKIKQISKPSRRVYWTVQKMRKVVRSNSGLFVLSTSNGIEWATSALRTGGEVICKVA
ncbi:MAG: 30S ribosomal protein S8 [Candidatus Hodgkinia cicadicola]